MPKEKNDNGADLLTVQPLRALVGIGYTAPNDDWSVKLQATYNQRKKAEDAQWYAKLLLGGRETTISTYPYLSKSFTTLDLIATKRFGERININAGIYNLTNKQYWTWDSLRTIGGTNPSLATSVSGNGINRYLAPERYVMASVEFKF